jgi:putative two-component system response regulator
MGFLETSLEEGVTATPAATTAAAGSEGDDGRSGGLRDTTIVIVDDSRSCLVEMKRLLGELHFSRCHTFLDPAEAMAALPGLEAGVVLVDFEMPRIDGIAFIKWLRGSPNVVDVPVIMMTASENPDVLGAAFAAGAADFIRKPVHPLELRPRLLNLLKLRRTQDQLRRRARLLVSEVERATDVIKHREREIIFRLARAAEYRDVETGMHIRRMAAYCVLIGEALGMPPQDCSDMELAAPLHDLGKIAIRDSILLKPGALTEQERQEMQQHTFYGHQIVSDSRTPVLQLAGDIALCHHERWDGAGYPRGLRGAQIPLSARIAAVADVFDALTTRRPYKQAWTIEDARAYLAQNSGTQFCPACVAAFMRRWSDVIAIHDRYATDASDKTEVSVPAA